MLFLNCAGKIINIVEEWSSTSWKLGAGRKTKEDIIEPKSGLIFKYKIGDRVKKGEVLVEIRSESEKKINYVKENLSKAILLTNKKTPRPNLVKKVIK